MIVRRFLCIFYPPAEYLKIGVTAKRDTETFFANFKILVKQGYLELATASFAKKNMSTNASVSKNSENSMETVTFDENLITSIQNLKKGMALPVEEFFIKEGETSPPKRYNSGSIILAMENAGQLIEEEELRAQIKGSGIGTSATRAEILSKLVKIKYLKLNKKTQIITPELLGEMVYDVVDGSIRSLLNPELTASWELGLTQVAEGQITEEQYMAKLNGFITVVFNMSNKLLIKRLFVNNLTKQLYIIRNEVFHMYDSMKNKNLFNMEETIAKDIFEDCDYPWEVLPKIEAFILELGKTLSEDEYDCIDGNIWIAKSATIAPTASITGPCIIGKNTEVRQCAFIRGKAIVGEKLRCW